MAATTYRPSPLNFEQLVRLGKPRVVALIVFTAVIGMFLATPGLPPPGPLLFGALQASVFVAVVGGAGLLVLHSLTNPLTMWLTLATFLGYAIIYTIFLKPRTPQNIVIGGASGAMPPVLGWCAVTGEISADALLLFLIIFAWTPPHFWALALYRRHDYARAGVPMLPVTHGDRFTRLHVLLYTLILSATSLLPFASGMSGTIYLASALALNGVFVAYAVKLCVNYSDGLARRTFRYSIVYLSCLFAVLLIDHYWRLG